MKGHGGQREEMSGKEFAELFDALSTWGRWGEGDERGTLHFASEATVVAGAALVRDGRTFGLGRPLDTRTSAHNPKPADHHMTMLGDEGEGPLRFAMDYVGQDYHHHSHSHIDALCHVSYRGSLYNGFKTASTVREDGAAALSVDALHEGLVGRGVLLDVPGVRERSWLEPGESVFRDDLEAAEQAQGVSVGAGDILFVRTGYAQRMAELGETNGNGSVAGLHPTAMTFVADRRWQRSVPTGIATPHPARRKAWRSRSTFSPSTRWGCTLWTTWPSRNCERHAPRRNDGTSSSLPHPCGSAEGQARRSTRSRSCDMARAKAVCRATERSP